MGTRLVCSTLRILLSKFLNHSIRTVTPAYQDVVLVSRPGRAHALRHVYRDCLRKKVNGKVHFILLDGSRELITDRMKQRKGHFMPPALLDSQFATLEKPTPDEHAVILDISHPVPALLAEAARSLTSATAL